MLAKFEQSENLRGKSRKVATIRKRYDELRVKPFIQTYEDKLFEGTLCHNWEEENNSQGYGNVRIKNKTYSTHRLVYVTHKGKVPEKLVIDHRCKNTACCNILHLEAITHAENVQRDILQNVLNIDWQPLLIVLKAMNILRIISILSPTVVEMVKPIQSVNVLLAAKP